MNLGTAEVIRADSRSLPLADDSVDLVITSPPYFALRSYQDGGEHYDGQIGAEPTPDEFVTSLLEVTAECVRVLKPSGSLWVNLGDKYSGYTGPNYRHGHNRADVGGRVDYRGPTHPTSAPSLYRVPPKSLIGIPWRYALRCIDELGLILRAEVIWSKPNGLPESVTDRVRRSHEAWFHFTLNPRYFSAVDEIREGYEAKPQRRFSPRSAKSESAPRPDGSVRQPYVQRYDEPKAGDNPLGKLPGSVWTVPTEPLRVPDHLGVDHFAAFPTEWPKRIIQGWSPAGVCVACGEGRRPVSLTEHAPTVKHPRPGGRQFNPASGNLGVLGVPRTTTITGYACACTNAEGTGMACGLPFENPTHASHEYGARQWCPGILPETRHAVVLDPFGGTGTTAMVAKALGRHGISVDMSADYCRLAEWRTNDRDQLAKVLGIAKVEQQPDDQLSIFDLGEPA